GSSNVALGANTAANVTTADNVICIGSNVAGANVTNTCFIGNIFGATIPDGAPVYVATDGRLGTVISSSRFKDDIKPIDKASEAILALKPVRFHYKGDAKGTRQFGLIAEDVADVNRDLVVRDKDGEIYSVRYDAVNAMLLNEFLKAHRRIEQQDTRIEQLDSKIATQEARMVQQEKGIEALTAELKDQAAQIQKVSARMGTSKPS